MSKITAELETKDGKKVTICIEDPNAVAADDAVEESAKQFAAEPTITETDDSISFSTPSGKILTITIAE